MKGKQTQLRFYERKQRAFKLTTDLYNKGIEKKAIFYNVMLNYGIGKKIVEEWLEDIEDFIGVEPKEELVISKEPKQKPEQKKKIEEKKTEKTEEELRIEEEHNKVMEQLGNLKPIEQPKPKKKKVKKNG